MESSLTTINPDFALGVKADVEALVSDVLGGEKAREAAGRISLSLMALAKRTPGIMDCTPASVAEAVAMSVVTGLIPGGAMPTCYVLPRKNRDGATELNWQLGFRGMLQLCQRAGFAVAAYPVYPGRVPEFDAQGRLVIPSKRLPPVDRTVANLIGVIVKVRRIADGSEFADVFVEADLIEARRNASDAYQRGTKPGATDGARKSPWFQWEEEMALKTAIRYAISRGAVPVDDVAQRALEADGRGDIIEADAVEVTQPPRGARAAVLGALTDSAPASPPVVIEEEREPVAVEPDWRPRAVAALQQAGVSMLDAVAACEGRGMTEWTDEDRPRVRALVEASRREHGSAK